MMKMMQRELDDVLNLLEETPRIARRVAGAFPTIALSQKPAPDIFSVIEQICHLRDIEREGYSLRIRKMLEENQPFLPDLDGDRLARERDYNSQNFKAAMSDFTEARQENVNLVRSLSADQLNRSGMLEGVGRITIEKLLLLMREHDQAHRKELMDLSLKIR